MKTTKPNLNVSTKLLAALLFLGISVLIPLSASANLDTGLVAHYPFNGSADDASGYGNTATVYGATLTADRFGNPNSAYLFNGISAYIQTPVNSNYKPISFSVWFRPDSLAATGSIVDSGASQASPMPLLLLSA